MLVLGDGPPTTRKLELASSGWTPIVGASTPGEWDILKEAINWAGILGMDAGAKDWWEIGGRLGGDWWEIGGNIPYQTPPTVPFRFREDQICKGVEITSVTPGAMSSMLWSISISASQ